MTAKKCRDFSAEEVVRATVLDGAIRASDLLIGVSASSTAAAARYGVERLQRLLLGAQTVAFTREAVMSEWRRKSRIGFCVGVNFLWESHTPSFRRRPPPPRPCCSPPTL